MNLVKFICSGLLAVLLISQESVSKQIFCGNELRKILDEVCVDGYHPLLRSQIKRSIPYADSETDNDLLPLSYSSLFMDPLFGEYANIMAQTRRRRYGAYDDCCRKGCSYSELALYCK